MNFIPSSHQGNQEWPNGQQHQYESLTGLLLRENTPTSYNDDDSYKHHPAFGLEEDMNARRERDEKRLRGRSLFRRLYKRHDSPCTVLLGLGSIFAVGSILGLLMPSENGDTSDKLSLDWDTISNMLRCSYFLSWTLSFYPQIITNCKRPQEARRGVSIDFLVWNVIGFACYAAYVTCFMYSDSIRKEYADRFGGGGEDVSNELSKLIHHHVVVANDGNVLFGMAPLQLLLSSAAGVMGNETAIFDNSTATAPVSDSNTTSYNATTANTDTADEPMPVPQVKFNDVAFAWHALVLSIVTFVQIVWCSKSNDLSTDPEENEENISSIECSIRQYEQVSGGYVTPQSNEAWADANSSNISPAEGSVLFNEHQQMHLRRQLQTQGIHEQLDPLVESENMHKLKLRSQSISWTSRCLMIILLKFCIVGVLLVLVWSRWQWIDYLYFLSFVKVVISVVKYIPQVSSFVFVSLLLIAD